jgi:superfamily II DNA/RNA helicase
LLRKEEVQNALIFCNRKVDVSVLYKSLKKHGFSVGELHGDMDQSLRFATLNRFKAGEIKLLVCSDVAARGLDIDGLSHVFNFDVPFHAEDYVHRIGRTGRAGREGHAYTLSAPEDAKSLAAIEKLTGRPIPRMEIDGLDPVTAEEIAEGAKVRRGRGGKVVGRAPSRAAPDRPSGRSDDRNRGGDRGSRRESGNPRREERGVEPQRENRAADPKREERRPRRDELGELRDAAPRRPEPRRDDNRRDRRDDLGPPVRGFGDSVPAFMLIAAPRTRRDLRPEHEPEAEAA